MSGDHVSLRDRLLRAADESWNSAFAKLEPGEVLVRAPLVDLLREAAAALLPPAGAEAVDDEDAGLDDLVGRLVRTFPIVQIVQAFDRAEPGLRDFFKRATLAIVPDPAPASLEGGEVAKLVAKWKEDAVRLDEKGRMQGDALIAMGVRKCLRELEALAASPTQPDAGVDRARFERAPCYLCGYNGAGYYQPTSHPCAARYHAAQAQGDAGANHG